MDRVGDQTSFVGCLEGVPGFNTGALPSVSRNLGLPPYTGPWGCAHARLTLHLVQDEQEFMCGPSVCRTALHLVSHQHSVLVHSLCTHVRVVRPPSPIQPLTHTAAQEQTGVREPHSLPSPSPTPWGSTRTAQARRPTDAGIRELLTGGGPLGGYGLSTA